MACIKLTEQMCRFEEIEDFGIRDFGGLDLCLSFVNIFPLYLPRERDKSSNVLNNATSLEFLSPLLLSSGVSLTSAAFSFSSCKKYTAHKRLLRNRTDNLFEIRA